MIKKVKKIPKYSLGTDFADKWNQMSASERGGAITGAISAAASGAASALGVEQGKNAQIFNAIGAGLDLFPGGKMVGDIVRTFGAYAGEGGHVDKNTGEYTKSSGLTRVFGFGRSDNSVLRESNRIKNNIQATQQTENLKADYYNNPNVSVQPNVLAAEGGVMRRPVDALVSKGELIYNPMTKKLSKVPGSKGKPNKADDVYARLYEGDVVISNSPTMLMANGKTPAQNLEGLVDKYSTGGTVKAREAIIKKVVNWQEANKTKPQEYAKFSDGINGVNKYGYNKNLSEFAYWDKDKNEYKKEYLDWVNNLTEQDVRDIEAGKYGDMSEYFSKNKGKQLDVATAQKLMTDKKYGNWHKIGKAYADKKIKAASGPTLDDKNRMIHQIDILPGMTELAVHHEVGPYALTNLYTVGSNLPKLERVPNPSEADGIAAANRTLRKAAINAKLKPIGETISDLAPLASALFGDYDYHTEQPQISPAKYVPTGVSIEPIRRSANESYVMARYNQANISPNTGAGMAYGLQAASNRAKTLADAYAWLQDTQNKLIAQNAGIYNDWSKRYDAARYQAIADTRANEAAAQQMRDSAIRDALEFAQGRRNDRMRLAVMEPLAKYAFDDETYRKIYKRAIV